MEKGCESGLFDELPETESILRWSARRAVSTGKELIELSFTELPAHGEAREPSTPYSVIGVQAGKL